MAKKKVAPKRATNPKDETEPETTEPETTDETENDDEEEFEDDDEGDEDADEKPAQIAVDKGDGVYQLMDAPGGIARALVVTIDGKEYTHVDEHDGVWAYRSLDPPS